MRAIMQKYPYLVIERDGRIEATPMPTLLWDVPPTTGPQS